MKLTSPPLPLVAAAVFTRARTYSSAVLTIALVLACAESTSPVAITSGIRFLAGAGQADTVDAVLTGALVVEVRDTLGRLVPGQAVRFEVPNDTLPVLGIEGLLSQGFSTFVAESTSAQGRAAVLVRLGSKAGTVHLRVSVPLLGFADSAQFTVRAGAPFSLTGGPSDTTISLGASFQLRARVTDRHGNARSESVTYQALDAAATVSSAGVVTAQAAGLARILATAGSLPSDTLHVSIVPAATIVASSSTGVTIVNLDGSGSQVIAIATADYNGRYPTWLSATSIAAMDGQYYAELLRVSTSGAVQYLVPTADSVVLEVWPQAARDGSWIYFGGLVPGYSTSGLSIWRVQPSGDSLQRVSPANADGQSDTYPSPSPDGTRLAVATTRFGNFALAVLNVATKQLTALNVPGIAPRWAPAGDSIAYLGGSTRTEIHIVNANGGGNRRVSPAGRVYWPGMDWSPDRRWIIARGQAGLELVEVATGNVLPLVNLPDGLSQPAWKP